MNALPEDFPRRRLPIPAGWYFVSPGAALRPGAIVAVPFCGRDLAVWRTASGRVRAAWNVCPHLGGRLAAVGEVDGEALVCGLHRRRYGADGRGERGGCLALVPVIEQNGLVLAWFHPDGAAPTWTVPPEDDTGFAAPVFDTLELATHPQLVMQDLADLDHFVTMHRYSDLAVTHPLSFDGPSLRFATGVGWDANLPGVPPLPITFRSHVYGLGYQVTEVDGPGGLSRSRHYVLPTPVDARTTRVHLGLSARLVGPLGRALGAVPGARPVSERIARRFIRRVFLRDVRRDVRIWTGRYQLDDVLDAPDDAIRAFRAWSSQFYGHARQEAAAASGA